MYARIIALHAFVLSSASRARSQRGQTTAEYALVLLGAGAVAVLLIAWAGQTKKVSQLLDATFKMLVDQVKG